MSIELVRDIIQDLNAGDGFQELVESIYNRLREAIPCNRLGVALYDPVRDRLTVHACKSDGPTLLKDGYGAPVQGSSLEPLLRTGEPRIIGDLNEYLLRKPNSESTHLIVREGMRSSLTVPLIAKGKPIGALFFSSRTKEAYTDEHKELSRLVAGHISVALERSLLNEEVRSSKEYLESILENSADAIMVVARDRRILSWNRAAQRMFGYRADEVVGKKVDLLVPPEVLAKGELDRLDTAVDQNGFISSYETLRMDRNGRTLAINLTLTAIRDRHGKIMAHSSILRDLTHLKRIQEDLVRTQSLAAVGELAATVAHEIRNPLAGISGAIQVCGDAFPEGDPRRAIVGEILAQVKRLDETVRDLLVFSKPWKPDPRPVDLVDVIERTAAAVREEPRMEKVLIRRETPASLPLKADPHLLQEVLVNLLQNAADAMPKGGLIRLVGESHNGTIRLRVIDSGTGIPPRVRERLFSPFFTTKTRGTGLGLAISKKIIEAHGGRIDIEGLPGQGTEVAITLPKEPEHVASNSRR